MNGLMRRLWRQDRGALTYEWILLITVIVIGVVGGLSAVRDAVVSELGDVAGAVSAVDQSWSIQANPNDPWPLIWGSFTDHPQQIHTGRPADPPITQ